MPELPEVETVVRGLAQVLPGKTITSVEVLREKSSPTDLEAIVGLEIVGVERKAKMIVVRFLESEQVMLGHLKMTGQLIWRTDEGDDQVQGGHPSVDWVSVLPSTHTRIVFGLNDGSKLYFNDQRVFGWMKVVDRLAYDELVAGIPPDVVDAEFSSEYLGEVLASSGRAVKLVILDQQKMGGLGNIYANDALYKAGIDPARPAQSLSDTEVVALHRSIRSVIERAIDLGGSSYSDFVDHRGLGGRYQDEFLVYDRDGEVCLREDCEGVIEKVKIGARGSYYCPACQK